MLDLVKNYKESLKSDGTVIGDIRRNTANELINYTFTEDPDYKTVRILKQDGWHLEDAKYQYHVTQSISSNAVDWYLQFRPGVHYPIGTYVLIPDDDETMPRTFDEEKHYFAESRKKAIEDGRHSRLWFIVDRNYATHFVRYNIVRCNWTFRWIYRGKIQSVIGAIRSANSYTSGVWNDEYSKSPDNLTGAWIPDLHYVYGDNLANLGLDDNRTLDYEHRLMISNNDLFPRVYEITKVVDFANSGVVKYSIKQDQFDEHRDNAELEICDYYSKVGQINADPPEKNDNPETYIGSIKEMMLVDDELTENPDGTGKLKVGVASYFKGEFSSEFVDPEWHVELIGDDYTDEQRKYLTGLMKINEFNDHNVVMVKPGKASSLKGKQFKLVVSDINGNYYATYDLEVEV